MCSFICYYNKMFIVRYINCGAIILKFVKIFKLSLILSFLFSPNYSPNILYFITILEQRIKLHYPTLFNPNQTEIVFTLRKTKYSSNIIEIREIANKGKKTANVKTITATVFPAFALRFTGGAPNC